MDLQDRIFIALLATLLLAVLVIEKRKKVPAHILPPVAGTRLLQHSNIPDHRPTDDLIPNAAYEDVSETPNG